MNKSKPSEDGISSKEAKHFNNFGSTRCNYPRKWPENYTQAPKATRLGTKPNLEYEA